MIQVNKPPKPCKPFTTCWCEQRPHNPNCEPSLPIDDYIPFMLIIGIFIMIRKYKSYGKVQSTL